MTDRTQTAIREGQLWQEVDPRFPELPHKRVLGFSPEGKVLLKPDGIFTRVTKAKPERFNGKRGGYRLIEDVSNG